MKSETFEKPEKLIQMNKTKELWMLQNCSVVNSVE